MTVARCERGAICYDMRLFAILTLMCASPAAAWEFSPSPVCTLSHTSAELDVELTYDPRRAAPYSIALTAAMPWPDAPVFGLRFFGGRDITITTDRQEFSDGGRTVSVQDNGFGNVLDGLEFNAAANAFIGGMVRQVPLDGAAEPVQAFRACVSQPSV